MRGFVRLFAGQQAGLQFQMLGKVMPAYLRGQGRPQFYLLCFRACYTQPAQSHTSNYEMLSEFRACRRPMGGLGN